MSDEKPKYPAGAQLAFPDGSVYVYAQMAQDIEAMTYVEQLPTGRIGKFKGGKRLPPALVIETTPKEWWTFAMVKPADEPKVQQKQMSPEDYQKIIESTKVPQVG